MERPVAEHQKEKRSKLYIVPLAFAGNLIEQSRVGHTFF
jgi:hypothetical protein